MRNILSTLALTTLVCFAPNVLANGIKKPDKIVLPKGVTPNSVITGLPNLNTIPTQEYDAGVVDTAAVIAEMTAAIQKDPAQAEAIVKEMAAKYPTIAAQIAAEAAKIAPQYAAQIASAAAQAAPAQADAITAAVTLVAPSQAQAIKDAVAQTKPATQSSNATGGQGPSNTSAGPGGSGGGGGGAASQSGDAL